MSKNRSIGNYGEQQAVIFLRKKGYTIVEKNWRAGKCEIDIIATYLETTIFIEVKTRTTLTHGLPEDFITESKINAVTQAAQIYLEQYPALHIRFDVISILLENNAIKDILHIQDAFY